MTMTVETDADILPQQAQYYRRIESVTNSTECIVAYECLW